MQIKIWISTNKIGSRQERIVDLEDDMTEEEIEATASEIKDEMLNWNWERM